MAKPILTLLSVVLLLVHAFLVPGARVGLAEWLLPSVPWSRVSTPELPRPILLLQRLFTGTAGVTFIPGYFLRWPHTPVAMAVI